MKKRYVLKEKYKNILLITFSLLIVSGLMLLVDKMDQDFVEQCTSQGYSLNYCKEKR